MYTYYNNRYTNEIKKMVIYPIAWFQNYSGSLHRRYQ